MTNGEVQFLGQCIAEQLAEQLGPLLSKAELLAEIERLRPRSGGDRIVTHGMLQKFIQGGCSWQSNGGNDEVNFV
jgi:hypothetical protein